MLRLLCFADLCVERGFSLREASPLGMRGSLGEAMKEGKPVFWTVEGFTSKGRSLPGRAEVGVPVQAPDGSRKVDSGFRGLWSAASRFINAWLIVSS